MELIREPAILYLDEPTSGLSSTDSEKVIMLLKEQTHRGRLVVVNIHQPSSEIYKLFDRLWLLDTGGYPIYDGNPIEAITYFKRIANYTDQDISVCGTCGNINPELILTIIDAKKIDDSGNQTNIRKITSKEWHELYVASRPKFQEVKPTPLPPNHQQKPSIWKQFCIFLERNIKTKLTNKQYLCIALLETPLLAVIVALLTRFVPDDGYSLLANKNLVSYIFMAVIVATFTGLSISAEGLGREITVEHLAEIFLNLQSQGAHNINLVTPGQWQPWIIAALDLARAKGLHLPIVCNTGGYETVESVEAWRGYIDIWLADLKYVSSALSAELSAAPDYFAQAKPAIEAMMAQAGHPAFDAEGILQKGVILRHLALPGHIDDSFAVLDQMAAWNDADPGCFIPSVMSQYTPFYKAAEHGIGRRITTYEYRQVVNYAMDKGLAQGYMQQKSSAKEEYTPSFDLTGV